MKSDLSVLKAYLSMILDGSAFSNWRNKPDNDTRIRIVESILENERRNYGRYINLDINSIETIVNMVDEVEIKREIENLMNSMEIKEEEFMV